jgi:hypothetical protein
MIDINLLPKKDYDSLLTRILIGSFLLIWVVISGTLIYKDVFNHHLLSQKETETAAIAEQQKAMEQRLIDLSGQPLQQVNGDEMIQLLDRYGLDAVKLLDAVSAATPQGGVLNSLDYSYPGELKLNMTLRTMNDTVTLLSNLRKLDYAGQVAPQTITSSAAGVQVEYIVLLVNSALEGLHDQTK